MAAADYNVADRKSETGSFPVQANDKVEITVYTNPDDESKAAAATAHVTNAAFIGYAAALNTFESRTDIETLADRRSREYGTTFSAGDFMRDQVYNSDGTVRSAPRPGSVHGDADKSA